MHTQKFEVQRLKVLDSTFTLSAAVNGGAAVPHALWLLGATFGDPAMLENPTLTEMSLSGTGWFPIDCNGADHIAICGSLKFGTTNASITFPQSRLVGAAVGLPHRDSVFLGLPQATTAASSSPSWRGMNLGMHANDWIGQPVSTVPAATATLSDNSILNVYGSGAMSAATEDYYQFWVGHRQNNLTGANMSAAAVTQVGLPSVTGLDRIWVQFRLGFDIVNGSGAPIDVTFISNLAAVKFRNVMSIDSKQAYLMGGRSSAEQIGI